MGKPKKVKKMYIGANKRLHDKGTHTDLEEQGPDGLWTKVKTVFKKPKK